MLGLSNDEDARAILVDDDGNPTPHYQAYLQYEEEYKSKITALNQAYEAALSDPIKFQNWPIDGKGS